MTRCEIEQTLNELYKDLNMVYNTDEETACVLFSVDSKAEAVKAITEEVDFYEETLREFDEPDCDPWDNHGFADEADYVRWRYGA